MSLDAKELNVIHETPEESVSHCLWACVFFFKCSHSPPQKISTSRIIPTLLITKMQTKFNPNFMAGNPAEKRINLPLSFAQNVHHLLHLIVFYDAIIWNNGFIKLVSRCFPHLQNSHLSSAGKWKRLWLSFVHRGLWFLTKTAGGNLTKDNEHLQWEIYGTKAPWANWWHFSSHLHWTATAHTVWNKREIREMFFIRPWLDSTPLMHRTELSLTHPHQPTISGDLQLSSFPISPEITAQRATDLWKDKIYSWHRHKNAGSTELEQNDAEVKRMRWVGVVCSAGSSEIPDGQTEGWPDPAWIVILLFRVMFGEWKCASINT